MVNSAAYRDGRASTRQLLSRRPPLRRIVDHLPREHRRVVDRSAGVGRQRYRRHRRDRALFRFTST